MKPLEAVSDASFGQLHSSTHQRRDVLKRMTLTEMENPLRNLFFGSREGSNGSRGLHTRQLRSAAESSSMEAANGRSLQRSWPAEPMSTAKTRLESCCGSMAQTASSRQLRSSSSSTNKQNFIPAVDNCMPPVVLHSSSVGVTIDSGQCT